MIRLAQRKPPTLNNSFKLSSHYNYETLTQTSRLWLKMHTSQLLHLRNGKPQLVNSERSYSSSIPSLIDNNNIPFSKPQSPKPEIHNSNTNTSKTTRPQQPGYSFYKANSVPERGSAFQISYSYPIRSVFITGANQKGPKLPPGTTGNQFDWENKILMKLSINECGKLLSVLEGTESTASLFHSFEKEGMRITTTLKLEKHQTGKFVFQLNKAQSSSEQRSMGMYIELFEAAVLKEFLRTSIRYGVGFT